MLNIKVFLADRGCSTAVKANYSGQWIKLPATEDEISTVVSEVTANGEYALIDHECTIEVLKDCPSTEEEIEIGLQSFDNISRLNKFVSTLSQLEIPQILAVSFLIDSEEQTPLEALSNIQEVTVHHYKDLEDVAFDFVAEGAYGQISDQLRYYVDYDLVAHVLLETNDKFHYNPSLHTTFEYH